jgi:peptidoglycan/xylan/chitin deacetylase (PgdA/CDA1 family)/LysM repeat protein
MAVARRIILCIIAINLWVLPVYAEQVHRVAPGETLSGIARLYGITTDSLLGNNQYIVNPDLIFPGQVLIIPDTNMQAYVIKPGDTLSQISQQFQVPIFMLADINDIDNINLLYAGQVILIPQMYTVRAGDTLSSIAQDLGVDLADLLTENNLSPSSFIYIGQSLVVPFRPPDREELAAIENELSPVAQRFPDTFFYKGQPDGLRVALTFDDGPDRVETNAMLDILKRYRVPATFFLLGRNMPGNSQVVERIVAEGHTVANHSTTHPDLRELTEEQVRNEMLTLENEIYNITGLRTALMRPPYGFINDTNIRQLRDMGYKVIKWTVDTKDWRDMDIDQVLINTMPNIRDGSIILMHDYLAQSVTKEVLPEIIHSLRSQGYTFVTVDELIGVNPYK